MNEGSAEAEAVSAAANFVASVLTSVMEKRGEAVPPIAAIVEQSAELLNDRDDLDELFDGLPPSSGTPLCMQHRSDSRQLVDTPSTEIGLTPSPGGWRSQPSTSQSFGHGRGAMTPAPGAATSLTIRASSSMGYVREAQTEGIIDASLRASTSMDYVRESQHEKRIGTNFFPSPPRTTPGPRRPVLQRGSSFPGAANKTQMPACPVPAEELRHAQENETKDEYTQLAARLSARQFLSGIILGKVLSLGAPSMTMQEPLGEPSEAGFLQVSEGEERVKRSEADAPEVDDASKFECCAASSSAGRPSAPPRGQKGLARDKAQDIPQPKPPSSQPPSRPSSRQGVQAQASSKGVTAGTDSPRRKFRKQSLPEEKKLRTEVNKRRASDVPPTLTVDVAGDLSARTNNPRSSASPTPPSPSSTPSAKSKGKARQEKERSQTPQQEKERAQSESAVRDVCPSCENVFKADSNFCRKCGAARPTEKVERGRLQRRSTVSPMLVALKSKSQRARGESDAGRSLVATPEEEDELLSYYDVDIHGGTFGVLGVDTPDIIRCESVSSHASESGGHGSEMEIYECGYQVDEYGNPVVLQSNVCSSEMPTQVDWQSPEGVAEYSQQMQPVHNHHVAFEQDTYEFGLRAPYTTSQAYAGHGHAELSMVCDPQTQLLMAGSCMPVGWAAHSAYDSNNAVAQLGYYNTCGFQTSAKLEATVSGEQLGQLLASSCGMNLISSSPLTLTLDEQTIAAVYAASGVSLNSYEHLRDNYYESGLTNAELAARQEEALLASADSPIVEEELTAERRVQTGRRGRESTNAEQDLVVVKARGSSKPAAIGLHSHSAQLSEGSLTQNDSRQAARSALGGTATGLQVESVRLLEDLNNYRSRGASLNIQSKRPKSVGGVLETSARTSSARMSPFDRACGELQSQQKSNLQNRPTWNTAFMNIHERRIPRYDALIDGHCPVMTSPIRLKQVLQTREMSSEYLHIVRSRFESHRRFFDPEHKLGDRSRPESATSQKMKTNNARMPATFLKRVTELQNGAGEGWDDNGDQSLSVGPEEDLVRIAPSLASSTEWYDMPLYHQCFKEWKGEASDGLPSLCPSDDDRGSANEELPGRWTRLRGRIELLWRELLIPPDVQTEIFDGPFMAMTADSVYRLEMHQKELVDFRLATKRIIHDCLKHDEILEDVQHSHALGVNDNRLSSLREHLLVLDRLGSGLVRAIGVWSRRFGHLVVDAQKLSRRSGSLKPRAVFVWKGRDMIERIQTVSDAISSGSPQLLADAAAERELQSGDFNMNAGVKLNGQRSSAAPKDKERKAASSISPLVSLAMVSQKFSVNDVLHEGPPPTWYHPRIARAGIAAIRRGIPCGGGDKRV